MNLHGIASLLLLFSPFSSTHNILVLTPWTGTHYSFPLNIATTLATTGGHNVTFLALLHDPHVPVSDHVTYIVAQNISSEIRGFDHLNRVAVESGAMDSPSERMIFASITGNPMIADEVLKQLKLRFDYIRSDEMKFLLERGDFKLLVVEETVYHPVAILSRRYGIPLLTVIPVVDHQREKNEQNLPVLLTSEASQFLNIRDRTPPTFGERLGLFLELGSFGLRFVTRIVDIMADHLSEEDGLSGITDLDTVTQLYLINDHPALSFPNLQAPNSLNIAGIGFSEDSTTLNEDILEFLSSQRDSPNKKVVLVSLGSLAFSSEHYSTIFGREFLTTLTGIEGVSVIVYHADTFSNIPNVFTADPARADYQALLATGGIHLVISSCDNSDKVFAVLHKVPIICIPLFTDQYFNSLLVMRHGFGEILVKEDFSHAKLKELVMKMAGNLTQYRDRMAEASRVVMNAPSPSEEKLVFYTNLLMERGNLDYLRNHVILKQSVVEIYNLDIVVMFLMTVAAVFVAAWFTGKRVVCWVVRRVKCEKLE